MNARHIEKLKSHTTLPIKKDEIKRKIAEDKRKQDALRLKHSNK